MLAYLLAYHNMVSIFGNKCTFGMTQVYKVSSKKFDRTLPIKLSIELKLEKNNCNPIYSVLEESFASPNLIKVLVNTIKTN